MKELSGECAENIHNIHSCCRTLQCLRIFSRSLEYKNWLGIEEHVKQSWKFDETLVGAMHAVRYIDAMYL